MTRFVVSAVLALGFAMSAVAEPWPAAGASDRAAAQGAEGVNPYAQLNDSQWTKVVERWERLDGADRRWFLTEARKRNARIQDRHAIVFRQRARFGNVAKPGEAERRTERRHLRRPAQKPAADDPNRYGLGFEQRQRKQPATFAQERREREPPSAMKDLSARKAKGTVQVSQPAESLRSKLKRAPQGAP